MVDIEPTAVFFDIYAGYANIFRKFIVLESLMMSKKKKRKATKLSTVTYLRRMLCNFTGFAIKHKAKKLALFWFNINYHYCYSIDSVSLAVLHPIE